MFKPDERKVTSKTFSCAVAKLHILSSSVIRASRAPRNGCSSV